MSRTQKKASLFFIFSQYIQVTFQLGLYRTEGCMSAAAVRTPANIYRLY